MVKLNELVHQRARLLILTFLAGADRNWFSFNQLMTALEMTAGNLSVQLKKLNQAGYVEIKKTFKDNKPLTTVALTPEGSRALKDYLAQMEGLILSLKD